MDGKTSPTVAELTQKVDTLTKQNNRTQVLFESIEEKYQAIQEGITVLLKMPPRLERVEQDLGVVKDDIKVIKTVVRENSRDIAAMKSDLFGVKRDLASLK